MVQLLNKSYKSEENNCEILSYKKDIQDKDLLDLVNSGLITGKIIDYSTGLDQSFLFETENIILPNFIFEEFGNGTIVIGLPIELKELTNEFKKQILTIFYNKISSAEKIKEIQDILKLNNIITELQKMGRDNTASIFAEIFNKKVVDNFDFSINIFNNKENKAFFALSAKPSFNIKDILEEYIQAVVYENNLYKSKVGSEKLCFCPLETKLGSQLSYIINTINDTSKTIRELVAGDFISAIEEVVDCNFDEYIYEHIRTTGIDIHLNHVTYFKNVCCPYGMVVLFKDINTGNTILGELKEQIELFPQETDLELIKNQFTEIIELEFINKL